MPKVKASLSDNKRMEEMQNLVSPNEEPESQAAAAEAEAVDDTAAEEAMASDEASADEE